MQAIDVIVIKERGGKCASASQCVSILFSVTSSPHLCPQCHHVCFVHSSPGRENPKWDPSPCQAQGTRGGKRSFHHLHRQQTTSNSTSNHAGTQGSGPARSHQGLIRAVSGPTVMDQQQEVAGQWFPDCRVVAADC